MTDKPKPNLQDIRRVARELIAKGHTPLPLPNGQKRPLLEDWQTIVIKAEDVDRLFTEGDNIGLRLDTLTDADLDTSEARALAQYFLKPTPAVWGRRSARASHHLYHVPDCKPYKFQDPMAEGEDKTLLEIRFGNGYQTMFPPSVHPEGELLHWEGPPNGIEDWTYPEMYKAMGRLASATLLSRYLKEGSRQFIWLYLSGAMRRAEWPLEQALHFVEVVCRLKSDEKIRNRLQAVKSSYEAEDAAGLKKLEEYLPVPVIRKLVEWLQLRKMKFDPLDLTDDANANTLFVQHGEDLRYLPNEGKGGLWVSWNDIIWQRDRLGAVVHLAANTLKKKADELTASSKDARVIEKVKGALLNMPGINGAMDRLTVFPEIATASLAFDANPFLVGCQNGIYNLKLGRLEEGMREHLVSRQVTARFVPNASCPRWLACLQRAQHDSEVRAFLQRLAGSCLIGEQTEHGFIFNYGQGANFKTAFSEALRRVMGSDYACTPNEELFFQGNQEVPRNYLADIFGMRLLTTNEKHEGSEWNIDFVKRLFGGQELNACRKYCESFTFVPTARVLAAANNKPRLNELDEALRRRFLLVPWEETIPETGELLSATETNPAVILRCLQHGGRIPFEHLMALLLEEKEGIFAWMIEGAREFIKGGLRLMPPASILAATEGYFEDEDVIGRFVKDCCKLVPIPPELKTDVQVAQFIQKHGSTTKLLHQAFTGWAQFGKHSWGRRKVALRLEKVRGVVAKRGTGNQVYINLVLNESGNEARAQEVADAIAAAQDAIPFGGG